MWYDTSHHTWWNTLHNTCHNYNMGRKHSTRFFEVSFFSNLVARTSRMQAFFSSRCLDIDDCCYRRYMHMCISNLHVCLAYYCITCKCTRATRQRMRQLWRRRVAMDTSIPCAHEWHDAFVWVIWLFQHCDTTQNVLDSIKDSGFSCVTYVIHMCVCNPQCFASFCSLRLPATCLFWAHNHVPLLSAYWTDRYSTMQTIFLFVPIKTPRNTHRIHCQGVATTKRSENAAGGLREKKDTKHCVANSFVSNSFLSRA